MVATVAKAEVEEPWSQEQLDHVRAEELRMVARLLGSEDPRTPAILDNALRLDPAKGSA